MSAHDARATVRQIRDAARHAQEVCADKTLEALLQDWLATAALERFLEIVGEGVKRLPPDLRDRYQTVPWKEIAGTRDHLSHGYDDVDYQVLWDAVKQDVPLLIRTIEQMLQELEGGPHEESGQDP